MEQNNIVSELVELVQRIRDVETSIFEMPAKIRSEYRSENRSLEIKELFAALSKAQGEMDIAIKSDVNPFFKSKYASFPEIVRVSRPVLAKHGLCVVQQIITQEGKNVLNTILAHSSGEWISSQLPISPIKQDVQELGKYITYLKRYSYAALVGVVDGDEDDDGESHMQRNSHHSPKPIQKNDEEELISIDQLGELEHELNGHLDIAQDFLNKMKLKRIEDLPKSKYRACIDRIREIKRLNNK